VYFFDPLIVLGASLAQYSLSALAVALPPVESPDLRYPEVSEAQRHDLFEFESN
jgi:hypothetical protein